MADNPPSFDLGCPEDDEYPLVGKIVYANGIAGCEDDLKDLTEDAADVSFLKSLPDPLPMPDGAADMNSYRFFAKNASGLATAGDILNALRPKHFHDSGRVDLSAPGGLPLPGAANGHDEYEEFVDEIHNDFESQQFWPTVKSIRYDWVNEHFFDNVADPNLRAQLQSGALPLPVNYQPPPEPPADLIPADAHPSDAGIHGLLKSHVRDNRIWYVKIHSSKTIDELCNVMFLFVVGVSPTNPNNLIGIIAGQAAAG